MTTSNYDAKYAFHHLHINTGDYDRAFDFYTRVMGGSVDHTGDWNGRRTVAIDLAGMRILISDKVYPWVAVPGETPSIPFNGVEHISLSTPDLEATVRDLKSRGAEFFEDLHTMRGNLMLAIIHAPDNVRIELLGASS